MLNRIRELFNGKNERVEKTKNKFNADMLTIHVKAKKQLQASQELVDCIENTVAYKIAIASGRMKR